MVSAVTAEQILSSDSSHSDRQAVAPQFVVDNATDLAAKLTLLMSHYGNRPTIHSGYRTPAANKAAGGAPKSSHITGQAVDFRDPLRIFSTWCLAHLDLLAECELWMEDPASTPTWTHLQSRPVPGKRVFQP